MKTFLTAAKEDRRLPYVIAVFALVTSAFVPYIDRVFIMDDTTGVVTAPYGLPIALAAAGACALIFIIALVYLIKYRRFEERQDALRRDERDRLHEYIISTSGYTVLIIGLSLYTIYTGSIYITGLLLSALLYRFYLRMKLDRTA